MGITYIDLFKNALDILIVAFIIYRLLLFIKGTRAIQMLIGLILFSFVYLLSEYFEFTTTHWIMEHFWSVLLIAILILFQPEIRAMLAEMGQRPIMASFFKYEGQQVMGEIIKAVMILSERRIGALIVLERETKLRPYVQVGAILMSRVTERLILSIFQPESPLHDGAIIIGEDNRIFAAGCYLPLTSRTDISKYLGTRHRAAVGISEETDAVVIVVSEETGTISIAEGGQLYSNLSEDSLRERLQSLFKITAKKGTKK
ncbi:MAG: TIGR00159 family protein [Candidatus Schekmanbacteria bacterium]|nr:MAG: TIGR00159 family protein [Candidatus Schekmanbacteria bacterium]